jgi:hypothetical protein
VGGIQGVGEGDTADYLESYSLTSTKEKMAGLGSRHIKKQTHPGDDNDNVISIGRFSKITGFRVSPRK